MCQAFSLPGAATVFQPFSLEGVATVCQAFSLAGMASIMCEPCRPERLVAAGVIAQVPLSV